MIMETNNYVLDEHHCNKCGLKLIKAKDLCRNANGHKVEDMYIMLKALKGNVFAKKSMIESALVLLMPEVPQG